MIPYRRTVRFFVLCLVIELAMIALAFAIFGSPDSDAHTVRPAKCDVAARVAPAGSRWQAKQRCLGYADRHHCVAHGPQVPRSVRVKGARADSGQRRVIRWIVREGQRRRLPATFTLAALVGTTQEASARELPYGEGTSLGPFQLIDDHGSARQRISIEFSGNWFFNGATKEWRRLGPMSAPALAQEVEESGHPRAYGQWLPESRRTLAAVLAACRLR